MWATILMVLLVFLSVNGALAEQPDEHETEDKSCYQDNSHYQVIGNPDVPYSSGIADQEGNILVPPQFYVDETPLSFLISDQKQWGFLDKQSGTYHEPQYDAVWDWFCVNPSYPILVGKDGQYCYIGRATGEVIIPRTFTGYCEYSEFCNGYAVPADVEEDSDGSIVPTCYLIDLEGNVVSFPEDVMPFGNVQENGLIRVITTDEGSLFGIGNTAGEVVLQPQFDYICDFQYGYASVRIQNWWGHVNEQGELVCPLKFDLYSEDDTGYFFQPDGTATFQIDNGETITIDTTGCILKREEGTDADCKIP